MSTFLTAHWRHLIMAQYAVSPDTLAPYLPTGVELDLYQGQHCYVSLVGFIFDETRVLGLPIPFYTRFEEVNLRFYVLRHEPDGTTRRGVVFIRELVPRHAITFVANTLYQEPYATTAMRHTITETTDTLNVEYGWRYKNKWHTLAVEAANDTENNPRSDVADFITEHYWGYTKRTTLFGKPATTSAYEVHHPRWRTFPIRSTHIDVDFADLYGPAFAALNHQQPDNVLLAEGSPVSVLSGIRLPA